VKASGLTPHDKLIWRHYSSLKLWNWCPHFCFLSVVVSADIPTHMRFIHGVWGKLFECWRERSIAKVWYRMWRKWVRRSRTYLLHVSNSNWISILRFGTGANPTSYLALSLASVNPRTAMSAIVLKFCLRDLSFSCITRKSKMLFRYQKHVHISHV
jgi:hypothetical protein